MIRNYIKSLYEIVGIKKLYLLLIWVSFFASINLNPNEYENFNIVHKLRLFLPAIFIFISFFVLKKNYKALASINTLIFIFFIACYLVFNLLNPDNPKPNLFWPIYMFLALLFMVLFLGNDEIKFLLQFTILIIFLAFIVFMYFVFNYMIEKNIHNLYGIWGNIKGYSVVVDYPPRSSGLARYAIILFTISFLSYLITSPSRNVKITLILLTFIFGLLTVLFQSRTITAIFIIINLLILFFYYKKIFKKKIIFLFVLILPILITLGYEIWKQEKIWILSGQREETKVSNSFVFYLKSALLRTQINNDLNTFSSGRSSLWLKTIDIIKKNPLKGHGAQSDRLYIEESVHNAFLYAWLSGGIISALFIFFVYLKVLQFFFIFLRSKTLSENLYFSISLFVLIIILLKSLLDTSFAIYGIDYLLFLINFYFLLNHKNIIND